MIWWIPYVLKNDLPCTAYKIYRHPFVEFHLFHLFINSLPFQNSVKNIKKNIQKKNAYKKILKTILLILRYVNMN